MVKRKFAESSGVRISELQTWQRLVAGACAGLCYWVPTYPFDIIKGRMMASPYNERINWISTLKSIYTSHGYEIHQV